MKAKPLFRYKRVKVNVQDIRLGLVGHEEDLLPIKTIKQEISLICIFQCIINSFIMKVHFLMNNTVISSKTRWFLLSTNFFTLYVKFIKYYCAQNIGTHSIHLILLTLSLPSAFFWRKISKPFRLENKSNSYMNINEKILFSLT